MTQNNVYLKDLPYEFLKNKDDNFFDSNEYSGMSQLFDSKKESAPLLDKKQDVPSLPSLIIQSLATFLSRRYLQDPVLVQDETELTCLTYIRMASKIKVSANRNDRLLRRITKDLKSLPALAPSVIRRALDNPSIRKFKNASIDKALLGVPLIDGLRPAKTENAVKDIIKTSRFYQETVAVEVFDDTKYRINRINSAIQDAAMPVTPFSTGVERIRDKMNEEVSYEFKFDDLQKTVELIRKATSDKYLSSYNSEAKLAIDPKSLREAILQGARSLIKTQNRFSIHRYDSFQKNGASERHLILHSLNSWNLRAGTVVKGQPDSYYDTPIKAELSNVATISFDRGVNISSVIIADNKTSDPIDLVVVAQQQGINVRQFAFDRPSDTWYLDFDGLDDGFILQYSISHNEIKAPVSVNFISPTRISINFVAPVSGELHLLAASENTFDNSDIVVSDENIDNLLANVNFFNKAFKTWKS